MITSVITLILLGLIPFVIVFIIECYMYIKLRINIDRYLFIMEESKLLAECIKNFLDTEAEHKRHNIEKITDNTYRINGELISSPTTLPCFMYYANNYMKLLHDNIISSLDDNEISNSIIIDMIDQYNNLNEYYHDIL